MKDSSRIPSEEYLSIASLSVKKFPVDLDIYEMEKNKG